MNNKNIDIIEVFIKKDLDIPLNKTEIEWLTNLDEEAKRMAIELINNSSYLDEIIKVMNHIIEESLELSEEEQLTIKEKCELKKKKLLFNSDDNDKVPLK